jgi:hypothetical protein
MANTNLTIPGLYRDMFRFMLKSGSTKRLCNDSKNHARILIDELLRSAKRNVLIFCRHLGHDVWDDANVLFALREALARGLKFSVLLQSDPEGGNNNRAFAVLKSYNVDVKKTNDATTRKNFIVVDGKSYRLEDNVEERSGCACANDPAEAERLKAEFDTMAQTAIAVSCEVR